MNRYSALFLLLFSAFNLFAQEQLGLRTGAYSGINATLLNPAATAGMPVNWDINLVEAATYAHTNYAFIQNGGLLAFWKARDSLIVDAPQNIDGSLPANTFLGDFNTNKQKKYVGLLSSITGPSFFFRLPDGTSLGFTSRLRFMAGAYGLPSVLDYYTFDAKPFYENFIVKPFHSSLMAWNEWSLLLGHSWETYYGFFGFGISGKRLQAYEAAYFSNLSPTTIAKLPGDSLTSLSADLTYGLTTTAFGSGDYHPKQTGTGWGLDLGIQWTIEGQYELYDWKFGVALLDLGRVQFSQNSQAHRVQIKGKTLLIDKDTLANFQRTEFLETTIRGFSEQVFQDRNASLVNRGFEMWLPAALSLQAEVCLYDGFFIQAQLVQRLPLHPAVVRGNLLALTPRYEQKYWGIWLPLSLYNYKELQLGLALKAGPLTLGTERLASLFSTKRWDGLDLYAAFKVPPFHINTTRKLKTGHRRGKAPRCYEF